MASRKELLDSLKPGMHLDKNFFLKVYGYEITRPGFADDVIKRLEFLGCSKAREYYTCTVAEVEYKREQEFKEVARWYVKQNFERKEVKENKSKGTDGRFESVRLPQAFKKERRTD